MRNGQIDEPDVTPLINVNLLVLVMALLISSQAAKLLPLVLPKVGAPGAALKETVALKVGKGSYAIGGGAPVGAADLPAAVRRQIEPGSIVVVTAAADAAHEAVGHAVDCLLAETTLQVFVDTKDAVYLRVNEDDYEFAGEPGPLTKEQLKGRVEEMDGRLIVLVSMAPEARYEQLVYAMDLMMARPTLKVAFGRPPGAAPTAGGATTRPAG